MKLLATLFGWRGTLDRGPFLWIGAVLALVKVNVDRLLVVTTTGRLLDIVEYWRPGGTFGALHDADPVSVVTLALVSLPFVWIGVVVCVKRLRSAGLSPAFVLLFFVPLLNLVLFAVLVALPRRAEPGEGTVGAAEGVLARWVPESRSGSAAAAVLVTLPPAVLFTWIGASLLGTYGWGLFLGIPFAIGLAASLIHGVHGPRTFGECAAVATLSILLVAGVLFVLAIEGAICIAMAAPLGIALALLGALVGWSIGRRCPERASSGGSLASIVVAMPLVVGWEHVAPAEPTLFAVRTAVEVDAPPAAVWRELVAFSAIPPPEHWIFRVGVAYPMHAEIDGHGVGAVRRCVFSTGAFVEPIEVWDEPRLLRFSVIEHPPAMRELTLFPGRQPPHVDDYLVSQGGQFLLEPLAGGRTRLEGTTWYTHRLWPERYWKPWSDAILHAIHRRVLDHIAERAEAPQDS
jgi:uncharacterized membrane protein YhaH (DUF805 family)